MAAHKKGQARPGPYTDANTMTTNSAIHDSEGYLIQKKSQHSADVDEGSSRRDDSTPLDAGDGFSERLPKR